MAATFTIRLRGWLKRFAAFSMQSGVHKSLNPVSTCSRARALRGPSPATNCSVDAIHWLLAARLMSTPTCEAYVYDQQCILKGTLSWTTAPCTSC